MRLGAIEAQFADMIWERAPIAMSELVQLCEEEFGWKRTTTYTVLKRLNERNLFCNNKGTVEAMISREDFYAQQSEELINTAFGGSLPAFLNAFARRKPLDEKEIEEMKRLIDSYEEK